MLRKNTLYRIPYRVKGFLVGSWTNTCEIPVDLVVVNDADGGEVQTSVCAASYWLVNYYYFHIMAIIKLTK